MMDIANLQQQYLLVNRGYTTTLNYTLPNNVASKYNSTIALSSYLDGSCAVQADTGTVPSYVITFSPRGSQSSDGALYLSSTGVKCPTSKW